MGLLHTSLSQRQQPHAAGTSLPARWQTGQDKSLLGAAERVGQVDCLDSTPPSPSPPLPQPFPHTPPPTLPHTQPGPTCTPTYTHSPTHTQARARPSYARSLSHWQHPGL